MTEYEHLQIHVPTANNRSALSRRTSRSGDRVEQDELAIGRFDDAGRLFRATLHDERELGTVNEDGMVYSHGLFEGGALGWLEADGVVMQGGMIFDEDEVGRVEGPDAGAAAAALLLIFLPDDAEADRRMNR